MTRRGEKLMLTVVATLTAWLTLFAVAQAQTSCGGQPPIHDQTLKADLEGKAQSLSKSVGDANLKGQIETARTDIFSKYPNAGATRSDAYLLWVFCNSVMRDPKLSNQEKLRAILEFRQGEREPVPQEKASTQGNQSPAISGSEAGIPLGPPSMEALPGNPTTPLPGPMPRGR
jgi:hypothetical protein